MRDSGFAKRVVRVLVHVLVRESVVRVSSCAKDLFNVRAHLPLVHESEV